VNQGFLNASAKGLLNALFWVEGDFGAGRTLAEDGSSLPVFSPPGTADDFNLTQNFNRPAM
jgi:hypothetical protein